jgi:hypothetical protein
MSDDEPIPELEQIRRDLRRYYKYVDDPELREEMSEWLDKSHERIDAESVAEFVSARLTSMLSDNEMYYSSRAESATDAFPDACSDCQHYGSACPVLVGPTEPEWRERKLDEATTEAEQRQVFESQAVDTEGFSAAKGLVDTVGVGLEGDELRVDTEFVEGGLVQRRRQRVFDGVPDDSVDVHTCPVRGRDKTTAVRRELASPAFGLDRRARPQR